MHSIYSVVLLDHILLFFTSQLKMCLDLKFGMCASLYYSTYTSNVYRIFETSICIFYLFLYLYWFALYIFSLLPGCISYCVHLYFWIIITYRK
jgi:hypothetical protein